MTAAGRCRAGHTYGGVGRASIVIPAAVVWGGSEGQPDVASARSFLVLARAMPDRRPRGGPIGMLV
jgi:hypothetical protein